MGKAWERRDGKLFLDDLEVFNGIEANAISVGGQPIVPGGGGGLTLRLRRVNGYLSYTGNDPVFGQVLGNWEPIEFTAANPSPYVGDYDPDGLLEYNGDPRFIGLPPGTWTQLFFHITGYAFSPTVFAGIEVAGYDDTPARQWASQIAEWVGISSFQTTRFNLTSGPVLKSSLLSVPITCLAIEAAGLDNNLPFTIGELTLMTA